MDPEINALPTGDTAAAGEQSKPDAAPVTEQTGEHQEGQEAAKPEGEEKPEAAKKEKTPEQREIERQRRRIDNLTRQKHELRARLQYAPQEQAAPQGQRGTQGSDDESVTMTRAEMKRWAAEQAAELAPAVADQKAEEQRRQGIVKSLAKEWGQEEFDAKASELDEVFGGLADAQGRPKPATDAIFEADNPKAVIEYLTDPDNADDAERIARLPAGRAGREILKLELKLKEEAAKAKPQPSKAAKPIESAKGGGVPLGMPDPTNTKAYIAWANAQERAAR